MYNKKTIYIFNLYDFIWQVTNHPSDEFWFLHSKVEPAVPGAGSHFGWAGVREVRQGFSGHKIHGLVAELRNKT